MQQATIILNGGLLAAVVVNFIRVYIDSYSISYIGDVTTFTIAVSALAVITITAAIATARPFGSYARIGAMTAIVGHMIFFFFALFAYFPGLGRGDDHWEPLTIVPMAVSAISVAALVRNVRSNPYAN